MAKTISDEQMKLTVIINGNEAQKQLFDLEKSTRKLNEENKSLLLQKKLLEKQGQKDTDAYRALTRAIKENNTEITANKTKMKELQDQLGLTGLTIKQLSDKALGLKLALRTAIPGSEAFQKYTAELKQVQDRMSEVSGKAKESKLSIGSLADSFNRYQGLALSFIATLTGVVFSIQKIIDINGKLSDAQADVMKTTGMTKDEVDALTKSFGLLQSRTSRIDLLGIAKEGGKLGIPKNEILDFVKVMDKATIALGEDFSGGAEEVANKLGKIKGLYTELRDAGVETSFEAVGSALNDLGADGAASEANIAEFVTRIGSMPEVFKPSIAEALGLGAAFEESGINAEKAGSNYAKVITLAANNVAGFAKQMGKPKKAIEDLINTNPTEFFLQFSQSLRGLSGTELAKVLDNLKLNDNEVKQILGAASQNTDLFRKRIDQAANSMNVATSLTNEYNIKNNILAATLEKIKKTVTGWLSSETFIKWLTSAVTWLAELIGATEDADGSSQRLRDRFIFMVKILAIVITSYISYNAALKLTSLWTTTLSTASQILTAIQNRGAVVTGVLRSAQLLLASAYYFLTGNMTRATAAMRLFNATAVSNPLGLLLFAITAVIGAMVLFGNETKKAATAQSMLADTQKKVSDIVEKESNTFLSLISIINDNKASLEARTAALEKAKQIGGEYTKGLTLENAATFEGKKMIDAYVASLEKKAMLQVLEQRQQAIMEDMQKRKNMSLEEETKWYDYLIASVKSLGNPAIYASDLVIRASKRKSDALKELQNQLNLTNAEMKAFLQANPNIIKTIGEEPNPVTPTGDTEGGAKKDPNSTQAEIYRLKLEAQAKYNEAALRLQRQLEDDRIAAMEDGYAKELAIENQRYQREIDDLQRQKVHTEEMAKLDEDIAKAKQDKDITRYNALLQIKKGWKEKNLLLDAQIDKIIEGKAAIHNLKLATIEEKGAKDILEKRKKAHDEAKVQRELAYQEELLALGDNEMAKRELTKKYEQQELLEEEKFLKELLGKYKDIIDKGDFEGINLDLLSPEQVAVFEAEAKKAGISLMELLNKINALKGKQADDDQAALGLSKVNLDIFGFSPKNWEQLFFNLQNTKIGIDEIAMATLALTNAFSVYDQLATAGENKRLQQYEKQANQKKTIYKKQLDTGYINQNQYNKLTEQQDNELAKKKADIELKQAKRQKAIALMGAIVNTARGVAAALPNLVLAGITAVMGGIQIATIAKQPLPSPGFEQGLYDTSLILRQQDGKVFSSRFAGKTKSGLVKDTSHFMVAENGPEMVIDNKAWRQMNPNLKDALIREIQTIKGFENGYYKDDTLYSGATSTQVQDNSLYPLMIAMLTENVELLRFFKENGLQAYVSNKDMNSMRKLKEGLDKYNAIKTENRK